MADQLELALNHNNAAGLQGIHELSPPLFYLYAGSDMLIHMEWFEGEGREMGGDRRWQIYGKPYVVVTFPWLTNAEVVYINGTLCANQPDNLVTARLCDEDTMAWGNYNAIIDKPAPTRDRTKRHTIGFKDVRVTIRDLEAL